MFLREKRLKTIVEFAGTLDGVDPDALSRCLRLTRLTNQMDLDVDRYLAGFGLSRTHLLILQAIFHLPDQSASPGLP
jgi:hypothetical protein